MKAYTKDIIQTIKKGKKRFAAIMCITALGVCMLSALKAACEDLRYTADLFFDQHNLQDISVVSTLGLTDEDVRVLASIDGVREVEGTYSETVYTQHEEQTKQAMVKILSTKGIDEPYLLEGRMPEKATEILVTHKYIKETEKSIGDTLDIEEIFEEKTEETHTEDDLEEAEEPNFLYTSYEIVGVIVDVTDINSDEGAVSFRSNSTTDYTFYVLPKAVQSQVYTAVYMTLEDTKTMDCYTDEYVTTVDEVVSFLEKNIKEDRENARHEEIQQEAMDKVIDAEEEAQEEFAEAEEEINDAKSELEEGEQKLADSLEEIEDAKAEIAEGWKEINDGKKQLAEAKQTLEESEAMLIEEEAAAKEQFAEGKKQLQDGIAQVEAGIAQMESMGGDTTELETQLEALNAQLATLEQQEVEAMAQIEAGFVEINEGKKQLAEKEAELLAGEEDLKAAEAELADAEAKLREGQQELEEGKQELEENILDYENKKAEALEEIEDAKKEIEDIKTADWYISTRTGLSGFSNIKTDAECIEAIGNAFPVLFLTIAILISLTTISRMVEEDRGLIGTYKALGFTDKEIRKKYVVYSLIACIAGGILGDLMGFILLPEIVFIIFGVMYQLPGYYLTFNWLYGIGGILLFIAGIVGAAFVSCETELSHMPATLMRPKTPKSGSRVLLERVTFIWRRLSFLNKVTIRNLFRYKKRFFMTIFGIAGCTALLLCGFTIKDTVTELMPLQYEDVYSYDVMAVADDNDKLLEYLEEDEITDYINTMITNVKVINKEGREETLQLIVVPEEKSIKDYVNLRNKAGETVELSDGDVLITINAGMVLDFEKGDTVTIQTLQLDLAEVTVDELVMNYLGNNVYMTQSTYEELFGDYEANGALINLDDKDIDQTVYSDELAGKSGILSSVGTEDLKENFKPAFQILNLVVYIVIVLAAALAFVVLFALATTNISERERELATIKVLGFFDKEVHLYVNKETIILTLLGILIGFPFGKFLGAWLMSILDLPSIYFETTLYPISYGISTVIAVSFAFIVNFITDRSLDKIDPVEALKSVE